MDLQEIYWQVIQNRSFFTEIFVSSANNKNFCVYRYIFKI